MRDCPVTKFHIVEIDKDYRFPSRFFERDFSSQAEAEKWCADEEWTGHFYMLDPRLHRSVQARGEA